MYKLILVVFTITVSFPISGICWELKNLFGSNEQEEIKSLKADVCDITRETKSQFVYPCLSALKKACDKGNKLACESYYDTRNRYIKAFHERRVVCFRDHNLAACSFLEEDSNWLCRNDSKQSQACSESKKASQMISQIVNNRRGSRIQLPAGAPTNLTQCLQQCSDIMMRTGGYMDMCNECYEMFP